MTYHASYLEQFLLEQFPNLGELKITSEQLFKAFKQSTVNLPLYLRPFGGGNCATIAVIKASMEKFGFGVFKSIVVDTTNRRFLVDLRDEIERVYSISYDDFDYAAGTTGFILHTDNELSRQVMLFATFCFSVMAEVKRCEYRLFATYQRAVSDFNRGEQASLIHNYLGLNVQVLDHTDLSLLGRSACLVVWNNPHAVYSSGGYYDEFFEEYRDVEPLTTLPEAHGKGHLEPIIGAFQIID